MAMAMAMPAALRRCCSLQLMATLNLSSSSPFLLPLRHMPLGRRKSRRTEPPPICCMYRHDSMLMMLIVSAHREAVACLNRFNGPLLSAHSDAEHGPPSHPLLLPIKEAVDGCLLVVTMFVFFTAFVASPSMAEMPLPHKCEDAVEYYKGVDGLKGPKLRKKLFSIIKNHHVLPYNQVWNALKVLDAADPFNPQTSVDIIEIYSQKAVPKSLAGQADGWNREHLWPRSYGIRRGKPEFSDLHNLRPSDANVNSARGRKYYGECMQMYEKSCVVPANQEAAPDTATDKRIWMPPSKVRGDIARALMYMAVRYGIGAANGAHFQLSDSPNAELHCMGLLSVLLHWNAKDPPSSEERIRNFRVCALYQHNRNPFVDHPEFADLIWRAPDLRNSAAKTPEK